MYSRCPEDRPIPGRIFAERKQRKFVKRKSALGRVGEEEFSRIFSQNGNGYLNSRIHSDKQIRVHSEGFVSVS